MDPFAGSSTVDVGFSVRRNCCVRIQNCRGFRDFLAAASDFFRVNPYEQLYHEWYHYYYDLLFLALIYPLTVLPLGLAICLDLDSGGRHGPFMDAHGAVVASKG